VKYEYPLPLGKTVKFEGFDLQNFTKSELVQGDFKQDDGGIHFFTSDKGEPLVVLGRDETFLVPCNSRNIFTVIILGEKVVIQLNAGDIICRDLGITRVGRDNTFNVQRGVEVTIPENFTEISFRHLIDTFKLRMGIVLGNHEISQEALEVFELVPFKIEVDSSKTINAKNLRTKVISYYTDFIDGWGYSLDSLAVNLGVVNTTDM
jgi:hypothetical protein